MGLRPVGERDKTTRDSRGKTGAEQIDFRLVLVLLAAGIFRTLLVSAAALKREIAGNFTRQLPALGVAGQHKRVVQLEAQDVELKIL